MDTAEYIKKNYEEVLEFGIGCNIDKAREAIEAGNESEVEICGECGEDVKDCETKKACYKNRYLCDCDRIHRGDYAACDECGGWNAVKAFHADKPLCAMCAGQILN